MNFFKGTVLHSIITGSCPVCQEENMYVKKNPFSKQLFEMHDRCRNCHTKYKIEPSFFYGSMYISYALGVGLAIIVFVLSYLVFNCSLLTSFILITLTVIALLPIEMRLSRNIWINLFMKFDKTKTNNFKQND